MALSAGLLVLYAVGGYGLWAATRKKKRRRVTVQQLPRIAISDDCAEWQIPDDWYVAVGAQKYTARLAAGVPEGFLDTPEQLEAVTALITDSILSGETGDCSVLPGPNRTEAMTGLFDHIAEYVRSGLQKGDNPFTREETVA